MKALPQCKVPFLRWANRQTPSRIKLGRILHAVGCLGRLLVPGCCQRSDFCDRVHSLTHIGQSSWNMTPSADSHLGARCTCTSNATKIPLQYFKEAFSLGLCTSQLWKQGKKSNIFLKSTISGSGARYTQPLKLLPCQGPAS